MKMDETLMGTVRRGDLLEIAQFLTDFKSHFCYNDLLASPAEASRSPTAAMSAIISPLDVSNALEYRQLLNSRDDLEQEYYVSTQQELPSQRQQHFSRRYREGLKDSMDKLQEQFDKRPEREKIIHQLLLRFEVWTTKVIAQEVLLSPSAEITELTDAMKPCCYSPFLNLPSAKHFYSILPTPTGDLPSKSNPDIPSALHKYKPSCCCLPLPPNRQTWKEFAKFVQILSILDPESLKKAKSSPCCVTNLTKDAGQKRDQSLAQYFQYQGHDLVPLWIRAKRNSQAMRQLWNLFTILPDSEESEEEHWTIAGTGQRGSGKQIVADLANPHPKSTSFKAVLQHNPNHTKSRVVDLTKSVDQLVEWAVVNQVVFTYRHMRACIQAGPQGKRRTQQLSGLYRKSAKRPRVEKNENENDNVELMHACRAYVLRWFARRNRKVATVLFASNQDNLHLDVGCNKVDRLLANLLKDKVVEGIRHYLERPEVSDITAYKGDRTLARIDRRLFIPGRYDSNINMASQVLTLLQALGETAPANQLDPALVQAAKSDFQEMYDHFFGDGKDAYDTARELLDVDTESTGDLAAILRSAPLPWVDKCCVCEAGPNERQLRTCANCEGVYHSKCSPPGKTSVRLADAVQAYEPLRDFCKLRFPADVPAPDFRKSSPSAVKWKTKIVTVDRPLRADGTPMPLGLMLRHTEECRGAFEALRSEDCLVSVLAEMIHADKKASRNTFPLAIDHTGYIITEVFGENRGTFCGRKAGLAVGDVIMALEILSFANPNEESQYQASTTYTFSKLDLATRLDLLKQKTTKLKMIILRPSHNVVKICTEWYTHIKRANKTLCTAFVHSVNEQESEARLWFCGNCVKDRPTKETPRVSATILEEASVCRAVIRRLAIESYSLPFIDEKLDANEASSSQEKSHSQFVSLRRLDNMMSSIIEDQLSDKITENPSSLISKSLRNAFCVPPWAAGDMCGQRLDWAPKDLEKQPMALLCRGIVHLLGQHGSDADVPNKEEKKSLSRHFLSVFCAWCVSMTSRGPDFPSTKGPSTIFLKARAPWLQLSCSECMARSTDGADSGFQICDNATCLRSLKEQGAGSELMGREEVLTIANATESYMHCASFVGATFLVLPEDSLVEAVSKIVPIVHDDRPVEFVVASYLPPDVVQGMKLSSRDDILDKFKIGDGVYHILPIVSFQQLKFLLERCQTRNPPRKVEIGHDDYSWTALDVLNLEGVARFSPAELQNRIAEHAGIRDAIDRAVVDKGIEASVSISDGSTTDSRRMLDSRSFMSSQKLLSDADDPLPQYRHLIESLIYDASHVFRVMAPANHAASSPNAPLDFERYFGEVPGAEKGLKKGFDIIIPASIPPSSGILQPEAVAENLCAVAYSDFYYESPDERTSLENALRGQTLSVPPRLVVKSKMVAPAAYWTILLDRVENPTALDSFKGIGWGVEIIQWKGEPALRIGRVCQPSPAHDAGLRTDDVVVGVSGSSPSDIGSQVDLICTFLGVTCRIPCKDYGLGAIAKVFSTVRSANIALGPVVLVVYRQPPSTESDVINVDENGEVDTPALDSDCEVVDMRNRAVQQSKRPHPIAAPHPSAAPPHPVAAPLMAPPRSFVDENSSRRLFAHNDTPPSPNRREGNQRWNTDNGVALPPEWTHLYVHLTRNISSTRPKLTSKHLYRPGINGMVFSLVETAVFCECVRQLQPLLGMRLLCPRYDLTTIFHQTSILKKAPPNLILTIPFIPDTIYWRLLRLDFQRASNTSHPETGDPIFFEGVHQYRMPADRLPIDRFVESLFPDEARRTRQQQPVPQQPVPQQQLHYEHGANGRYGGVAPFPHNNPPVSQPYRGVPMNGSHANSQVVHSSDRNVDQYGATGAHSRPRNYAYDNQRPSHAFESSQGRRDNLPSDRITNSAGERDVARYLNPGSEVASPYPESESPPERIRGGGPSSSMDPSDPKSSGGTSLDQIPPDDWRHKPVYSKVQTSNEGVYSEATLVGFVKAPKSSGAVRGKLDKAEIEAYYLSNVGYFDEPRTFEIESDSLFLIDTNINTEESRVVLKLQARNLSPKTSRDMPSRPKKPKDTQPSVEETSKIRRQLVDMTLSFMRRLGEMTVLGELPDGRDVLWLRSDPRALYVRFAKDQSRKEDLHQRVSARAQSSYLKKIQLGDRQRLRISRSNQPQHFCVWGCSVKATSLLHETLSFRSHSDLEEHYLTCHSFGSTADITTLGEYGQFLRIQDGRHILELSAALASAVCARRLSLIDEAVKGALQPETIPNGKVFYRSPQDLHLSFHLTQRFRGVILGLLRENDPTLCRPINLWSRIARLFVLEEEGQFRLNPTEYQDAISSQINDISPRSDGRVLACSCERTSTPDTEVSAPGNFECELCALQWEKVTRFKRKDPPKIATTNTVDAQHRSIGCALLSDASYPERLTSEVPSIPGRLGQAKSLLLKVALHMPEPLRNAGGASGVADPLIGYRIWNEDYFEAWNAFAREATNTRMLAQALVTMLASIHRARLPRWWRNEGGGWSTAQALVETPTLSAFFLHLYVLDAAIAEFMSTAYLEESTGNRIVSGSFSGRMEKYLKMADKLGFKRFDGSHEELCCFCDDGGSLLCCDLCDNVQHHSCCDPPIENPDVLSTWICDSCINDINVRYKHLKDEGAPVELQ